MPNPTVPLPGNTTISNSAVLMQRGDAGDAVRVIQTRLQAAGIYRGSIDGDYGVQTEQAIAIFQQANQLPPTGAVDPVTLRYLGFEVDSNQPASALIGNTDISRVRQLFPNAPVENIQKYLPAVIQALQQIGLSDSSMLLMALATIRVETGNFAPISEYQSKYNTSGKSHPFDLYDFRKDLGNNAKGDGDRYKGRGFIQLTGKHNYQLYSQKLGLGSRLIEQPELANDPQIAARILASFLKDKEQVIRQALARQDYASARKAVNGGTHGLDSFKLAFSTGLQNGLA